MTALLVACVGDDPVITSGAGSDAGAEGSTPVSGGGACSPITATDQFFECPLAKGGKETCPKATKACCPGTGCIDRGATCPSGAPKYDCMATPSCVSDNKVCCISGAFDPTPSCGLSSVVVPTAVGAGQCTDPALCKGSMVQLCASGSDCIVGECVPTAIVGKGVSFVVQTCK